MAPAVGLGHAATALSLLALGLNAELAGICGRCEGRNGFEAYRPACQEIDAVHSNMDFHLKVEV